MPWEIGSYVFPGALIPNWVWSTEDWLVGGEIYSFISLSVQMLCSFPQDHLHLWLSFLRFRSSSLISSSGLGMMIAPLSLSSFKPTYTFVTSPFIKLFSFLA